MISKESACNVGDPGSISGLGRIPGEGNGNPLQYSCLENSRDIGAWRVTIHGVALSQTRLSDWHCAFHADPWQIQQQFCFRKAIIGLLGPGFLVPGDPRLLFVLFWSIFWQSGVEATLGLLWNKVLSPPLLPWVLRFVFSLLPKKAVELSQSKLLRPLPFPYQTWAAQ